MRRHLRTSTGYPRSLEQLTRLRARSRSHAGPIDRAESTTDSVRLLNHEEAGGIPAQSRYCDAERRSQTLRLRFHPRDASHPTQEVPCHRQQQSAQSLTFQRSPFRPAHHGRCSSLSSPPSSFFCERRTRRTLGLHRKRCPRVGPRRTPLAWLSLPLIRSGLGPPTRPGDVSPGSITFFSACPRIPKLWSTS